MNTTVGDIVSWPWRAIKWLFGTAVRIIIVLVIVGLLGYWGAASAFGWWLPWRTSAEDLGLEETIDLPIAWRCAVNADKEVIYDPQVRNHIAELEFADSFGTSIMGLDPNAAVVRHFGWNCVDPYQVVANAYVLARYPIGDGRVLADVLPWLAPFKGDPNRLVDGGDKGWITEQQSYVYTFFPNWGIANPTPLQKTAAHEGNRLFQELAGRVNMTIGSFKNGGIKSPVSTFTVGVAGDGLTFSANSVPPLEISASENREAIMLYTKAKKADKDVCKTTALALNIHDQRLEIVENPCVETPPAPGKPKPVPPQRVVQQPKPVNPVGPRPTRPVSPPPGPPVPPPPGPPVENCQTNPSLCPPTWGKGGPVPGDPGILPAPQDIFEPEPQVPTNPFNPHLPESLPAAPITGDSSSDAGAVAPGASHSMPEGMDRGSSGAGTPPPVDTAAETPAGETGIGESTEPVG